MSNQQHRDSLNNKDSAQQTLNQETNRWKRFQSIFKFKSQTGINNQSPKPKQSIDNPNDNKQQSILSQNNTNLNNQLNFSDLNNDEQKIFIDVKN